MAASEGFLKHGTIKFKVKTCVPKIFFKTFKLQLLQGGYTVKHILTVYITEVSLFSKYLKSVLMYTKAIIDRRSTKIDHH